MGPDVAPSLRRALASAAACVTNGSDGPAASLAASAAAAASGDSTPFAAYVASGNAFKVRASRLLEEIHIPDRNIRLPFGNRF